ncbi:hypothetical protein CHCC14819_0490 [Bacillus licheniformis]|nr:hypothetical protein CHCC14819_0490 [Bacillus licheniformis]
MQNHLFYIKKRHKKKCPSSIKEKGVFELNYLLVFGVML